MVEVISETWGSRASNPACVINGLTAGCIAYSAWSCRNNHFFRFIALDSLSAPLAPKLHEISTNSPHRCHHRCTNGCHVHLISGGTPQHELLL